jgi:hypothetical protein
MEHCFGKDAKKISGILEKKNLIFHLNVKKDMLDLGLN